MKIIISPSKTKKINNLPIKDNGSLTEKEPFYLEITKEIIEKIKRHKSYWNFIKIMKTRKAEMLWQAILVLRIRL